MKTTRCALVALSLATLGIGTAPAAEPPVSATPAPTAAAAAPAGRLPEGVTPTHYSLRLSIDPKSDTFSGETTIRVTLKAPTHNIWMHGLGLTVSSVTVMAGTHRIPAHYEEVDHDFGVSRVVTDADVPAGEASLAFVYTAPFQGSGQGLYRTKIADDWYAFSQFEAIDARRAFPGFDEPGFKTPFDITLRTRGADKAVTNTYEAHTTAEKDGWVRHEFRTTRPLPTYLLTFAVGPLDIVDAPAVPPNAVRHTPLPLRIVAARGQAPRTAFAARESPKLLQRLEEYFGIPFPYSKLDLIASPLAGGAMENAGAIVFDDSLLLFGEHPTAREQAAFGSVTAHEMAHQWFGDLVTPAWWDDIWLNESFAEWMGVKVSDAWRPDLDIRADQLSQTLAAMNTDALRVGRQIHQPIATNAEISGAFDEITYEKGAGVLGMIESYLGEERFRQGVRLHLTRHAYGTATAADFFAAMAEGSGDQGVVDAFRSFVDQPGVPLLSVTATSGGRSLDLGQSRYRRLGSQGDDAELWKIPVCVHVIGASHSGKSCTLLTGRTGNLQLGAEAEGSVVHPNSEGEGYYRFAVDPTTYVGLLTVVPRLPAREALSFADSVGAAFDAGRLSFADLLAAAQVLANHPDRNAALFFGQKLLAIHDVLAEPAERPALERRLVTLYKPRLEALGYDPAAGRYASDPSGRQLLRQSLISLVALGGRDAEVRRVLAQAAQRSLDDPKALDPGLRATAWAVGVQELGKPFAERLEPLVFSSPDSHIRDAAVAALARAEDPPVADQARALTLDKRGDIRNTLGIVFTQMAEPATRPATWSWLTANRDALLARVPGMFQFYLARLGTHLCTPAEREQFDGVLGDRLSKASGGELEVGRTREAIDDCIALRRAVGPQLQSALAQAH
jgi:aminopeptidase N